MKGNELKAKYSIAGISAMLLLLNFVLMGCGDPGGTPGNGETNSPYHVYVAGTESNGTKNVAKFWKDGKATSLTDGSNNAHAQSIFVDGGNVYVVGFDVTNQPTYWKHDGGAVTPTVITKTGPTANARSIFVDSGNVYVAMTDNFTGIFLKDNAATTLSTGPQNAGADSIFVTGGNVYVSGVDRYSDAAKPVAVYWKYDGSTVTATDLTAATGHSVEARSIYVDNGGVVYVAGHEHNMGPNDQYVAKYWKDDGGTVTEINNPAAERTGYVVLIRFWTRGTYPS
jgi:hypothetical protein